MVYYRFGPFVLDPASRLLLREEQPVPITTKVFETLVVLVENRGRVMTKDELLLRLWPDTTVEEVNLAQNISTLRRAILHVQQTGEQALFGEGIGLVGKITDALCLLFAEIFVHTPPQNRLARNSNIVHALP